MGARTRQAGTTRSPGPQPQVPPPGTGIGADQVEQSRPLDILSGGRAELGLGAGGFWDAIAAMDGPRRSPADAVAALREAISVGRRLAAQLALRSA
jgi:hypothetical protein